MDKEFVAQYEIPIETLEKNKNPELFDERIMREISHQIIRDMPLEQLKKLMNIVKLDPRDKEAWENASRQNKHHLSDQLKMLRSRGLVKYTALCYV